MDGCVYQSILERHLFYPQQIVPPPEIPTALRMVRPETASAVKSFIKAPNPSAIFFWCIPGQNNNMWQSWVQVILHAEKEKITLKTQPPKQSLKKHKKVVQ